MTLLRACRILAMAHTRGDREFHYLCESVPRLACQPFTRDEYIQAWGVVRAAGGLKPEDYP